MNLLLLLATIAFTLLLQLATEILNKVVTRLSKNFCPLSLQYFLIDYLSVREFMSVLLRPICSPFIRKKNELLIKYFLSIFRSGPTGENFLSKD